MTACMSDVGQFTRHERNQPVLFDFKLVNVFNDDRWVEPTRGCYVKVMDDRWDGRDASRDGCVIFTGYVTADPTFEFLGLGEGKSPIYAYTLKCTSDEILANQKELPAKTYINKTRGFIIKDLLRTMLSSFASFPFDLTHVFDGGIERIYQVDTKKKFTEIVTELAEADGFSYFVVDAYFYYVPDGYLQPHTNDPKMRVVLDESDPRYLPENVSINPASSSIANDITVIGLPEPTTRVKEHFVSDGYQASHQLAYEPYGIDEQMLIEDEFTDSAVDADQWLETDTLDDFIQPFEGSLNIIGGTGVDGEVSLMSRKGIELGGIIYCRDGEIFFPPSPAFGGVGIIGGMYAADVATEANLFCGWKLYLEATAGVCTGPSVFAVGPDGREVTAVTTINPDFHYILRKTITCSQQQRSYVARIGADQRFGTIDAPPANAVITWEVEEINTSDPANITKTRRQLFSKTYYDIPEFVLYAPVSSRTLHAVMNYVSVSRPQQVQVNVSGLPVQVGNFLDGGRCAIVTDNDRSKLSWYAINASSTRKVGYVDEVSQDKPSHYWRMDAVSGSVNDHGTGMLDGVPTSVAAGASAISGDTNPSMDFNAIGSRVSVTTSNPYATLSLGPVFSFECWVKFTSTGVMPFFSNKYAGRIGLFLGAFNGTIFTHGESASPVQVNSLTPINDGLWHHVAWTNDGTTSVIYIDGEWDASGPQTIPQTTSERMFLGYQDDNIGGIYGLSGAMDEVAFYPKALTLDRIKIHYMRAIDFFGETVTIPPQGSTVTVTYWRQESSRARIRNASSVTRERRLFGDDGIRQVILRDSDIVPPPRSSEECQFVAQAYLADNEYQRYEATYRFTTQAGDSTELRIWPVPGDTLRCTLQLPDGGSIDQDMAIESVTSEFLGKDTYAFELRSGPINVFEQAKRAMILARRSSLDDVSIQDVDVVDALELQTDLVPVPDDPSEATILTVTTSNFNISMGTLPINADGFEVRLDDTGWGRPSYLRRDPAATFSLVRDRRDRVFFVRTYKFSGGTYFYSRRASMIRVAYPLKNNFVPTGLDGDISKTTVNIYVPMSRDPDFAGVVVRRESSTGAILYQGDGATHKNMSANVSVLSDGDRLTVTVANNGATTFTVAVASYNMVNELGTFTTFVVTRAVPTLVDTPYTTIGDPGIIKWTGDSPWWDVDIYEGGVPITTVKIDGDTTTWSVGDAGRTRTIVVSSGDSWGSGSAGVYENYEDDGVPATATLVRELMQSPSGDGKLMTRLTWDITSNMYSFKYFQVQVHTSASFPDPDNPATANQGIVEIGSAWMLDHYGAGQAWWYRQRTMNSFGFSAWSNVVQSTMINPLDPIADGGEFNPTDPALSPDITAGTGGRTLETIDENSERAGVGLEPDGRIAIDVPFGIDCIDFEGHPQAIINEGDTVGELTGGAAVVEGATRGTQAITAGPDYDIYGNLVATVQMVDELGVLTEVINGSSAVEDLGNGVQIAEWAGYAEVGLNEYGEILVDIPANIDIFDDAGIRCEPFKMGTTQNDLDDIANGSIYDKTTIEESAGGNRAWNALDGSNLLITGYQPPGIGEDPIFVDYMHQATVNAHGGIGEWEDGSFRVLDGLADAFSIDVDSISGEHMDTDYLAFNGFGGAESAGFYKDGDYEP